MIESGLSLSKGYVHPRVKNVTEGENYPKIVQKGRGIFIKNLSRN
jgi:hypothetical protein